MKTLEILTDRLVNNLNDISKASEGHTIYDLEQGTAVSFNLKKDDHIHVLDTFMSANTIFPLHQHEDSFETLTLYRGGAVLICDEPGCEVVRKEMQIGVPYFIPSGMNHLLHISTDSWIMAVVVPPDRGMNKIR